MKQNRKKTDNETKIWFFEKISKTDKPLARSTKKREREKAEIMKIRNESRNITLIPQE